MALEPITRQEKIIAGQDLTPITRMEMFLKNFGGGGGGVFEVFEATTTDMETLATGPSLDDISGCYSRGKIPVIKLTMGVGAIQTEFICTTGRRVYTMDVPAGLFTFDCIYNDNNSASSIKPIMKCVSIVYSAEFDAPKIQGGVLTIT